MKEYKITKHYWRNSDNNQYYHFTIEYRNAEGIYRPWSKVKSYHMYGTYTKTFSTKKQACYWVERDKKPIPEDEIVNCN